MNILYKISWWLILTFLLTLFPVCLVASSPETNKKKYRVAVVRYQHETCTFCPGGDTEVKDWTRIRPIIKGEEVLRAGGYIRGFVKQSLEFEDIEPVGISSPYAVFGGSSRSWNSKASFEFFMKRILDDIKSNAPIDGVYLALHGAMAVRDIPRPEAEIAKRIRKTLGKKVPIVATFDLHGNEDEEFLKWADGAFVTKRYPHYDSYRQGERAARYLRLVMQGKYKPTTATRKPKIITPTVLQWTGKSPSMDIMERARRWESRIPGAFVNVFYGYPWSDVPDVGATVHVMTNNNPQLANRIVNDMAEFIWRVRKDFAFGEFPMPKEAVQKTKQAVAKNAVPVVLGDYSDRPGDATWILRELINQGVSDFIYGTLRDEKAIEELTQKNAKAGDSFDMKVGGFTGESAGKPVRLKGKIKYFGAGSGFKKVAAIEFGKNNLLILTPALRQIVSPEQLRFGSINPDNYKVFIVKSRVHFRRGFDETGFAKTILVVDAPGDWVGTTRLNALDYKFAPIKELYPFKK